MDTLTFFFPSFIVQEEKLCESLRGHVECVSREGGGGCWGKKRMFWRCRGWKMSSSGRHVLSVSGQGRARGKQSGLASFPAPEPSAFIHGLILRAFTSSIVTQGLSKGFMPLTCAKQSGWQSQSSSQIPKPSQNALSPSLLFVFYIFVFNRLPLTACSLLPPFPCLSPSSLSAQFIS